jgi:hypothetical protein
MLVIVTLRMRGLPPPAPFWGVALWVSQQVRSSNPNWSPLSAGSMRTVSYPCGEGWGCVVRVINTKKDCFSGFLVVDLLDFRKKKIGKSSNFVLSSSRVAYNIEGGFFLNAFFWVCSPFYFNNLMGIIATSATLQIWKTKKHGLRVSVLHQQKFCPTAYLLRQMGLTRTH